MNCPEMPLDKDTIKEYAAKYDAKVAGKKDERDEAALRVWFKNNKYLDKQHFMQLCMWKTPRQKNNYEMNQDEDIEMTTRGLFATDDHEKRIYALDNLRGVGYPVASAILHFSFPDVYSIIDFRTIESLGWGKPPSSYRYGYWERYFMKIQEIAKNVNESIRTVDKALWMWSKEHGQKSKRHCA